MADRYWVGGAGTWDATTTTNWSATSGGAAGASAPTSADNVIFNTLSNATAYAVTVGTNAACLDVSIAGPATGNATITFAATSVLNVFGSWLSAAAGVVFSCPITGGTVNFSATTTGKTIATNNITFGLIAIVFNGAGGEWKLTTGFTSTAQLTANAGIFDTDGKALSINTLATTSTNVRSILLRASVISLNNNVAINSVVNLTLFNAGTSTISSSGTAVTFTGGGQTFYNVNFTSATAAINTVSITGANTFNNLNVTTTALQKIIQLGADQTVNGTLTLGATNTAQFRMSVISDVVGTQRTLTVATLATLADVDFRDINATGASAGTPWTGTRIGNCLGNNNIDVDASKFVYWNRPVGGIWTDTAWALTSGGAAAVNNFPLPQDFVIIEDTGLNLSATININTNADIGYLDMTARTIAFTLALGNTDPKFYSDLKLCSTLTTTGAVSPSFSFLGQGLSNILETAGVVLKLNQFFVNCPNGSLTLQDNTTVELTATSVGSAILTAGEFDINGFDLTAVAFSSNNTNTRAIAFGTGKIIVTGNAITAVNIDTATNFSYTGSGNIEGTYSGSVGTRTFVIGNSAGGSQAVALNLKVTAGTDTVNIYLHWNDLDFTGFSGTYGNPGNKIFYGNLTFSSGMTLQAAAAQSMTFNRTGTQTITSGTQTFTNLILYSEQFDNIAWAKNNVTVTPNAIVAPDSTTTADLVLDTATAGVEHYITAPTLATTTNQPYVQSVYVKASTAPSFLFMVVSVGASSATSTITFTQTAGVYAPATTANGLITSATATSVGNGWYRCSVIYTLNGTVTAHQMRLYPYLGGLYTGTGIGTYFWGAQAQIGATLTTYIPTTATTASITGDRIIDYPVTFSNSGTTNCLDALTLGSTRALTFTGGTLNLAASTTSTVGSFVTTGTSPKFLGSTTPGTQATISDASGTNTVSCLTIQDSNATGGAVWDALSITNIDAGDNTGWLFSSGPRLVNEITMRLRSFAQPRRF
jgi:hypothetical protein